MILFVESGFLAIGTLLEGLKISGICTATVYTTVMNFLLNISEFGDFLQERVVCMWRESMA
jgi:hypothetical protein